jgi:hypothetical protein
MCTAVTPYLFCASKKLHFTLSLFPFSLVKTQIFSNNFTLSLFAAKKHAGCPSHSWSNNNLFLTSPVFFALILPIYKFLHPSIYY